MSQSAKPVRVSSGPPWWLWLMMAILTVVVVVIVVNDTASVDPEAAFAQARAAVKERDKDELQRCIDVLKTQESYQHHVSFLEGMVAFGETRDPRALKRFAEIPDGHVLKPVALRRTGDAYRRSGKFEEAVKAYEDSVQAYDAAEDPSDGSSGEARVALSELYTGVGAYGLATETLDTVIEQDPENVEAIGARALIKSRQMEYDAVVSDLQSILKTPGDFAAASPQVVEAYATSLLQTNNKELMEPLVAEHLDLVESNSLQLSLQVATGNYEAVEQAIKTPDSNGPPMDGPEIANLELAVATEEWRQAEQALKALLPTKPRLRRIHKLAAQLYEGLNDEPGTRAARANVQQLLKVEADLKSALKNVSADVKDAEGREQVAALYLKLGDYAEMRRWYQLAGMMSGSVSDDASKAITGESFPRTPLVPYPTAAQKKKESTETDDTEKNENETDGNADNKPTDEPKTDQEKSPPDSKSTSADEKPNDADSEKSESEKPDQSAPESAGADGGDQDAADSSESAEATDKDDAEDGSDEEATAPEPQEESQQ